MTVEEYKKNRKSRLQRLKEAVESMPEVKDDGKANIQIDPALGAALETDRERDQNTKELFKDKNEETREFIKDQDKAREKEADIDKEDKSENRLMLDESLFTESYETDGFNIIDDLVDRAKLILKENGGDREDAIEKAVDEGLLYYDDILSLAQMYNVIDYGELQDKFYDMLIEDIGRGLDQ